MIQDIQKYEQKGKLLNINYFLGLGS